MSNWSRIGIKEPVPPRPPHHPRDYPPPPAYAAKALAEEAKIVAAAIEGTRETTLNTSALKLGQLIGAGVLDRALVEDQLGEAARSTGLPEREIEYKLRHGIDDGMREPRDIPPQTVADQVQEVPASAITGPDEVSPLLAGLRTGRWLDAQEFPPLRWIVPGLIPEGMTLLVGGPKIGKSWLSLDVALAAAAGDFALGVVAVGDPRPVLLLALEDGDRRLQDRIRKLRPGQPIPANLAYMTRIQPGAVVPTITAWLATLTAEAEPLVILDTLGKVMPESRAGESAYQRDYRVAGQLKQVCDHRSGMGLVILHHDRKASSDDFVDGVSGTNGIAGAADTIVVIARPRTETQGLLKVTGRDVTEAEYAATIEEGQWKLDGDSLLGAAQAAQTIHATANLSDRSAEILRYVNDHPEGVRPAEVAAALGLPANEASVYLGRLANAHRVCKPIRGLYTPVVSVVTVVSKPAEYNTPNTYNSAIGCSVCGQPLDPVLAADGETTHPTCEMAA